MKTPDSRKDWKPIERISKEYNVDVNMIPGMGSVQHI